MVGEHGSRCCLIGLGRRGAEMDFAQSAKAEDVSARMWAFMREEVFPAEAEYAQWRAKNDIHAHPPVIENVSD